MYHVKLPQPGSMPTVAQKVLLSIIQQVTILLTLVFSILAILVTVISTGTLALLEVIIIMLPTEIQDQLQSGGNKSGPNL